MEQGDREKKRNRMVLESLIHPPSRDWKTLFPEGSFGRGNILDIGCNTGGNLILPGSESVLRVGIDLYKPEMFGIKPDFEFVRADGRILPFKEAVFSTIVSSHVIEHVSKADGNSMLLESERVATRGALMIVLTPNLNSIHLILKRTFASMTLLQSVRKLVYAWLGLSRENELKRRDKILSYRAATIQHVHEYYPDKLRDSVARHFSIQMEGGNLWPWWFAQPIIKRIKSTTVVLIFEAFADVLERLAGRTWLWRIQYTRRIICMKS